MQRFKADNFHSSILRSSPGALWYALLISCGASALPLFAQPPAVVRPRDEQSATAPDSELWQRGQKAQLAGKWDDAISAFAHFLRLHPRDVNAMVALGYSHFKKGDVEKAETFYRQALKINNRHVGAGFGLGQLAMEHKKWSEATGLFADVRRIAPGFEPIRTQHNLALSLFALGRYAEAADVFSQALSQPVKEHYPELYLDALDNEIARADYEQAIAWGVAGAERYPQDAWLWNKLAWAWKMVGARRRSREAYARAEELVYADVQPHHKTVLSLPFYGQWKVIQGNSSNQTHRGLGALRLGFPSRE